MMDSLMFSFEMKSQVIAPKDGYVLVARFKHPNMEGFDTLFCDYASLQNGILQLFNARTKRLAVDPRTVIPQEFGSSLGNLSLTGDYAVQLYQMPSPSWYYQREEDLATLMDNECLGNPCSPVLQALIAAMASHPL